MGITQNSNGKKKSPRVWTKQDSTEFTEHLESRGFAIVSASDLKKQQSFIKSITDGLNLSDPKNTDRRMAVVWQDHLELLNTAAKVIMKLGLAQAAHDAAIELKDQSAIQKTNQDVVSARGIVEAFADHLADKEKAALDAVHIFDEKGKEVSTLSEMKSS